MSKPKIIAAALAMAIVIACSALQAQAQPASQPAGHTASQSAKDPRAKQGADLTIPWAIGGLRIERDGQKKVFPGDWPTMPVASMRIWDARTAWLNIEPAQDQWDFSRLDAFVAKAQAHGVKDILLTLGGTPKWAAAKTRPTDAAWLGAGSASPPKHWADWAQFVSTVAHRYQGRIQGYEIWNEPNSITYWSGTNAQWAKLTSIAMNEIAKADPKALIAIGGFASSPARTLNKIEPMFQALRVQLGATKPSPVTVSFHWYPTRVQLLAGVGSIASRVTQAAADAGMKNSPLWITEMNVRKGAELSAEGVETAMQSMINSAKAARIQRTWWYAWTDLGPPDLIQIYDGTPAARWLKSTA